MRYRDHAFSQIFFTNHIVSIPNYSYNNLHKKRIGQDNRGVINCSANFSDRIVGAISSYSFVSLMSQYSEIYWKQSCMYLYER